MEIIDSLLVGPLVTQLIFLGHAIVRCLAARRLGLEVARVRVGWGPKLWTHRTRGGALVELRLLPPLAMVAIRGHDPAAEEPSYRALYNRTDLSKRVLLTLATPAYYVCLTALPLFAIGAIAGWPEVVTPSPMIVGAVESDGPAELAGVELGDEVIAINGQDVRDVEGLLAIVATRDGVPTALELRRNGRTLMLSVTPAAPSYSGPVRIGIAPKSVLRWRPLGLLEAAANSLAYPVARFGAYINGVAMLFATRTAGLTGPVGMVRMVAPLEPDKLQVAIAFGTSYLVSLWLWLLLPLPFSPCGRLLLLIPEALGRAQPSLRVEGWMTRVTIGTYVALILFVTVNGAMQALS